MSTPYAIGALGIITLWAVCGVLWWLSKSEEIDEALAVIGVEDDEEPVPFDTHVDQAIALTHPYPYGCGPMCEAHAAAVERTRRSLDAHRERIADMLAVWSPQDEEAVRKLLDGAS